MGKMRKTKPHAAAAKLNPTGLPSVRDMEEMFGDEDSTDGPIATLVEQLQSVSLEEKMCALQALSFICQNQQRTQEIQDSDIVKIVASWLVDPNQSIRNATAGALRNLSLCGLEVCEQLVEQDVLTPLLALFDEYASKGAWVPSFDKSLNNQMDEVSDTFVQAINLLWNLCESTSQALDNFNQTRIVESFLRCLNHHVFGYDISIAVAQCLLVISEDNTTAWRLLSSHAHELLALLTVEPAPLAEGSLLLATLAAGIVSNVPVLAAVHLSAIFHTLSRTLEANHRTALGDLTSSMPLTGGGGSKKTEIFVADNAPEAMEEESDAAASARRRKQDLPSALEIATKHVGWLLEAQRVAAEIVTNLCSADDEESNADWEDDSDAESVHDYDAQSANGSSGHLQNTDRLPIEILEAIKSCGFVEKLWQKCQPIAENVVDILRINDTPLLKKINSLRVSSLLCLQNLCNIIGSADLGGPSAIYAVWLDLGQQVFQGAPAVDLLEASTALMRAALDHLRPNADLFAQMTDADLQLMLRGVKECAEPEIRANWLRMLGVLGCLLPEPLAKTCIAFIVLTSLDQEDAWTISEGADALMDMFSDNDWNEVVAELQLVAKTQELLKQLKTRLKQQKRELGERYAAVCTVRTNLTRFAKYIEEEQSKFVPSAK